ncbi:actin- protein 2/3 complex subunit 1 [Kluyveromyces marxianus]|nr:actin- protein 2/3 complex subunit 1 [Kluyveromyces marxianus]
MSDIAAQFKLVKGPIYSHCFNTDRSLLAITYDTDCYVYKLGASKQPQLVAVLPDHDKTVTAVDISVHGRIVTCSQDRNAIVWEPLSNGTYKPTLVLLRINRAATCVSWASTGYKFAVGSSARIIAVCYYEQENDWWVSKHIKKPIKSTINALSWHANSVLLACGGTDGYARVFSGFIKGLDSKEQVASSPWGEKFPFGSLVREWYQGAWIHDIKWRSSIDHVAYVAHDGSLTIVDYTDSQNSIDNPEGLPFKTLCWINDHEILAAGFSNHPVLFSEGSNGWKLSKILDAPAKAPVRTPAIGSDDADEDENANFGMSALRKFKELDLKGKVSQHEEKSTHENAITELSPYAESNNNVTKVSSVALDGKLVIYKL